MTKIAIAQIKPLLGNLEKNIDIIKKNIKQAIKEKSDLIIFPELALSGNNLLGNFEKINKNSKIITYLKDKSKKISIVIGLPFELENENYNSALYFENGSLLKIENKNKLCNYPFYSENNYYTKGEDSIVFDTKFGKCLLLIGEDIFEIKNLLSNDKFEFLIHIQNSYFGAKNEPVFKKTMEFYTSFIHFSIISVNRCGTEDGIIYNGGSIVLSNTGEEILKAEELVDDLYFAELELNSKHSFTKKF